MTAVPWITFDVSEDCGRLTHHQPIFDSPTWWDERPCVWTMVGKMSKSVLLDYLLDGSAQVPVHKDVYLWTTRAAQEPILIIDSGVQTGVARLLNPSLDSCSTPSTTWQVPLSSEDVNAALCGSIFAQFSSVVCYFVDDLGGLSAVAGYLAAQLARCNMTPDTSALPRILLVVSTSSSTFDARTTLLDFEDRLAGALQKEAKFDVDINVQRILHQRYKSIDIIGLPRSYKYQTRASTLRKRLLSLSRPALEERQRSQLWFNVAHINELTKRAITELSTADNRSVKKFSFVEASRPTGFSADLLEHCVSDFLGQIPSQSWLWHVAAPIIGSALLLASFPPHAHNFAPKQLFEAFFEAACKRAVASYTMLAAIQHKFVTAILDEFCTAATELTSSHQSASEVHRHLISQHHSHLAGIRSHQSCFCCFLRMPEKVLTCGHALCDTCVRVFSHRSKTNKYTYTVTECTICGVIQRDAVFHYIPPTAGIRVLSIDGGGIRGIVPLKYLEHLEKVMSRFSCSIKDHFDYVVGTSTGGLVAMGVFLLQWGAKKAIQEFENTATGTFSKQRSILSTIINDGKYDPSAIEKAFEKACSTPMKMFNPLRTESKVAVTTTEVKRSLARLIANYNGGKRPPTLGYDVERARQAQDDVTVGQAATCTSAAPGYFPPVSIGSMLVQDGGIKHNMPAKLATWEIKYLWPDRPDPDFLLSLGTGTMLETLSSPRIQSGMWSRMLESTMVGRFVKRLWKILMDSMDAQAAWIEFYNSLPLHLRHRFHRLNLQVPGREPSLDDATQISTLKENTEQTVSGRNAAVTTVVDYMISSMFYFELDSLPRFDGRRYSCEGFIYCRLDLPRDGLYYLYYQLATTSSYFYIQGNPVRCVKSIPQDSLPFRRRINFTVNRKDEVIGMSIRGITSKPRELSGFPTTLDKLISHQRLESPFGTIDHSGLGLEKPLPAIPCKRVRFAQGNELRSRKRARIL